MSTLEKMIQKMRQNPRDWRIEQIETIAYQYGITVRKEGGSHVTFCHVRWVEILTIPAKRPIKSIYVKRFINLLEMLGERKNEH